MNLPAWLEGAKSAGATHTTQDCVWTCDGEHWLPDRVTNFQARAMMRRTIMADGRSMETAVREMLAATKEAAAVLPENDPRRIEADEAWLAWEQSNVFMRSGALVQALGAQLGLTAAQIDDLFRRAAAIEP